MMSSRKYLAVLLLVCTVLCLWMLVSLTKPQGRKTPKCVSRQHIALDISNLSAVPLDFIKGKTEPLKHSTYQVPNIVHYIWYQDNTVEMRFDKALSILSAIKNLKPDMIYFHTNNEPTGKYYDMLKKYPVFKVVYRKPPTAVIKNPPFETTYSNYDKVKILIEHGGMYLDMDVMVVRLFDDIRKYGCTLGLERDVRVCAGIIVCAKEHPFLYVWLDTYYDDFEEYKHIWAFHSGNVPSVLIRRYPHLVHIEERRLHRPNYFPNEMEQIWGNKTYHWQDNYTIHTWIRMRGKDVPYPTEMSILTMNSTYGQIARQVYHASVKDFQQ